MVGNFTIQSNSMRGPDMQTFVSRVIAEMRRDIAPAFGPGASDYFMIKDGTNYYTRDGMEISESLTFDNELAKQIHNIMFQAAYQQAKKVGDGTTTMFLFYCYLYENLKHMLDDDEFSTSDISRNINWIRTKWKDLVTEVQARLKKRSVPMSKDYLKSMLYTATQDAQLAATIYHKLGGPIMEGAYIIPRKSNISTDFEMTTYMNPLFKATKQFTLREGNDYPVATILYCNGVLDIANYGVLLTMITALVSTIEDDEAKPLDLNIIILCHGLSERTRRTLRELTNVLRSNPHIRIGENSNNLTIFTLNEYRNFSSEELEDLATIITDEPGMGGLVQPLTFEHNLYKAFYPVTETSPVIENLETFDTDPHIVNKLQEIFHTAYHVVFDEVEGLAIHKELGPVARNRYAQLRHEIEEEKSEVRKVALNRRLKRSFGMFIDIQVGSALLKDSQRKYELILDAIISASTGVREGVLVGNSILHTIEVVQELFEEKKDTSDRGWVEFITAIEMSLLQTVGVMLANDIGNGSDEDIMRFAVAVKDMLTDGYHSINNFNLVTNADYYWISDDMAENKNASDIKVNLSSDEDEAGIDVCIEPVVVEPLGVMHEIMENSILPVELLKTRVFHISGFTGYMNNFID